MASVLENFRLGSNLNARSIPSSHGKYPHFSRPFPQKRVHQRLYAKDADSPDLIESLVGKIFGRKALEDRSPGGMKRLDVPEMFGPVLDRWADPVEGDSPGAALIRPLLAGTQLEFTPLRLAYSADRDGWSAQAFHDKVNTFGAGIVVARTAGGAIIGGYNPRGWIGLGEDRDSIAAFLFTWPTGTKDKSIKPVKLQKVGGASLAVVDKPEAGIAFGAEGLKLLMPGKERTAKCRLGTFFAKMPGGGKNEKSLFAPGEDIKGTKIESIECWVGVGKGETWELDGIIWKTGVET
jgi:TLD